MLNIGVAIVGTGHAGYTVAREYRRLARDGSLLVLSQDDGCSYSKPMLSNAIASKMEPAQLRAAEAAQMQERLKAPVMAGETVMLIDRAGRKLELASGTAIRYEKLVLAVGAEPFVLPLKGDAANEVVAVNDLAAYAHLRARLSGARRVTIIGAGLVGCEFANDIAMGGLQVDLLDVAQQPLARLLPPVGAKALADALGALGVKWHPGRGVSTVNHGRAGAAHRYTVHSTDGSLLDSDLVVSAVGLRPRTALAANAGLEVARGIVVDRQLRTSDRNIFAIGDCAEVEGLLLPYITPITHASKVLAGVLAGREAALRYPAMPVEVKTPACPALLVVPPPGQLGDWHVETNEGTDTCSIFRDASGQMHGYAVTGRCTGRSDALAGALPPVLA